MRTRGNGLTAASYVPLADIDPRATAVILGALRDAGVAAYAVAATSRSSLGWELDVPNRPVDRLYVDAAGSATARGVLDVLFAEPAAAPEPAEPATAPPTPAADPGGPEPEAGESATAGDIGLPWSAPPAVAGAGREDAGTSAPADLDSAWQQIIAGYDAAPRDEVPQWPVDEDLSDGEPAREGRVVRRVEAVEPAELAPSATDGGAVEEEHFVPPPPPPLPQLEPMTKVGWAGVLGGPAVLLAYAVGLSLPAWVPGIAVLAFISGFATLVLRLKDHPDEDPDDGAVV